MKKILLLISLCTIHFTSFLYAIPASNLSTISRVYGNYYSPAVAQNPDQGELGTLNVGFGTNGSLSLSAQLDASQAQAIRILSSGTILSLLVNSGLKVIAAYTPSGVLDTDFGDAGIRTLSDSDLPPYFMQLDSQENILIGGGSNSSYYDGWLQRISSAGVIDTEFATQFNATAGSWSFIGNIAQQSTGKLIIVGLRFGNTQVARLLASGALDTTFGTNGYKIFDATLGTPPLLNSTSGAYNVVVTQDDSILIAYTDSLESHAYIVKLVVNGQFATGFGQNGIRTNAVGAVPVVPSQIRTALDGSNNIIVGATTSDSPTSVGLLAFNVDSGNYASGIVPMNIPSSGSNAIELASILTLSNGYIAVVGFDTTNHTMRVDQFQPDGTIDAAFNAVTAINHDGTPGYLEFAITPLSGTHFASFLYDAAIAPNGQLFVAGYEITTEPSVIPYITQLYEYEYVSQIPQYPTAIQQGILDENFGGSSQLTYTGIVNPYLGRYRGNLQQHATSVIINNTTPAMVGDLIIGMYGSTDSNASTSMILNWLTPSGMFDTSVGDGGSGQLVLTPATEGTAEALFAMAQGTSGVLYVAGTQTGGGATLRKYSSASTSSWTVGTAEWSAIDTTASTAQGVGIALQGTDLVLLFENLGTGAGRITGYDTASGALANGMEVPSFGVDGAGSINSTSYGMHMGPVYGAVINDVGSIFVAYKNTSTGFVDVAVFNKAGSALVSAFGTSGIALNIFSLTGTTEDVNIDPTSVRIAFDAFGNLIICGADTISSDVLMTKLDQVEGSVDTSFGTDGIATMSFSNPSITQLQGISDGSTVFTGSWDGTHMYIARMSQSGQLDTTFNSQGTIPGVVIVSPEANTFAGVAAAVAIQSTIPYKGDLIVVGSQDMYTTDATPMVARIFGAPNTTAVKNYSEVDQYLGTLDVSFHETGALNLSELISAGTAQVIYAYPSGNLYEGMLLIAVDTGSSTNIARFDTRTLLLDPTFNALGDNPGMYTASELAGVSVITIDANNRVIFAGSQNGATWAQRLHADGTFDVSFDISTTSPYLTTITTVTQQKSGRYIVAGQANIDEGNSGLIVAYQDELTVGHTSLQVDQTFNPLSLESDVPGYCFTLGLAGCFYSIVVNADDTFLVAYIDPRDTTAIRIQKIMANASGLVAGFGDSGSGAITTEIIPSDLSTIRMVLDATGNIIIAASTSDDDMQVVRYTSAGVIDNTWNASEGVGQITTVSGCGHSVKLTSLLQSTTGQTVLLGYNVVRRINGIHGPMFAVSLNTTGVLDTMWNPYAIYADVPGILTYSVEDSTIMGTGAFAVNGNIYTVGGTGTEPLVMEIIASGISAMQDPLAVTAGILDTTINTQDTEFDALNLNTQVGLTLGTPKKLHIMHNKNGAMIMASLLDTTAYITKLKADLSLDTTFNESGLSSAPGTVPVPGVSSINDLFVADATGDDGNIYLTGATSDDSPVMWAEVISSDGFGRNPLTATNTLSIGTAIRQGLTNILIAGQSSDEGLPGVIVACDATMSQLDTSFGNGTPGYYATGVRNPIGAMTVDNEGRIYIAYKQGRATLKVQRLTANGSGIDMDFSDTPSSCDTLRMKIALDQTNNQLVVANYYSPGIHLTRYNTLDGSVTGTANIATLQLSDLFIDTDQNIYVVSYNQSNPYETRVIRFNSVDASHIALDTNYAADGGTPGMASVPITPFGQSGISVGAGILHPDRRVYVVGASSDNIPYMARFFGDNYATQVSQAIPAASPGDFDVTYGRYHGYAITFAGHASYNTGYHQQVKAARHLNSTKLMTVVDDGLNSWTVRVLEDGTNDPSYGPTPGGQGALITKLPGNEIVTAMIVSGAGEYFVIGNNSSTGTGYLKKITDTGGMDQLFGGNTGSAGSSLYPVGTVYGLMSNPYAVAELTNGNIVIAGNNAGVGTIQMLNSNGFMLTTFGNAGSIINGTNISSIAVDASNNIYATVAYLDADIKAVRVIALDETGNLRPSFGVNGIVDAVISDVADYNDIQIALDMDGKILIAATLRSSVGAFAAIQLEADGTISPGFNSGAQVSIALPNSTGAVAHIVRIVTLQNGDIFIAGYVQDNEILENNVNFVTCLNDSGSFKTTFNQYDTQGSIPGIAIFQAPSAPQRNRVLYDMDIQANGQIILAGANASVVDQWVPLTIRLIGYHNVQSIAQYPGDVPEVANVLNPNFNGTGVSTSGNAIHSSFVSGGEIAVDSHGNIISVGATSETFQLVRFLADGTFDLNFGTDGVATSPTITNLAPGCSLVIDNVDNVFVGGRTTDNQFVIVKFDAVGNVVTDYGTDGTPGVSMTNPYDGALLMSGGHIAIGSLGQVIIAGYSSTAQFAINQLSLTGSLLQAYLSQTIPSLMSGGYVAFDASDNLYIGGATSSNTLVAVKFNQVDDALVQDTAFNLDSGIASAAVTDFIAGGTIAIDSNDNIVIGGYTSNQTFAVARWTPLGILDPLFNETGIAYSEPIITLLGVGSIAVGNLNNVIIGGYARDYSGFNSMVVAVFTTLGVANTQFSATGTATTGDLLLRSVLFNVQPGGFAAVNAVGQILLGGLQASSIMFPVSRLVVAEMYSGYEIFVTDPRTLSPKNLKTFYYGNNIRYVNAVLALKSLMKIIANHTIELIIYERIQLAIDEFAVTHRDIPGYNLTWHLFLIIPTLQALQVTLMNEYESSTEEIISLFDSLISRINGLKIS